MSKAEIKQQAERMRQSRARWVLTDPVKADAQIERNRALRLSLEQSMPSSSTKP
ncbi:MAG: hypothetical protein JNN17_23360 [Verrucomicrobiaceae bacterium]|nr:hypothetical protein [Verrucomicrobiaceae bacterium]